MLPCRAHSHLGNRRWRTDTHTRESRDLGACTHVNRYFLCAPSLWEDPGESTAPAQRKGPGFAILAPHAQLCLLITKRAGERSVLSGPPCPGPSRQWPRVLSGDTQALLRVVPLKPSGTCSGLAAPLPGRALDPSACTWQRAAAQPRQAVSRQGPVPREPPHSPIPPPPCRPAMHRCLGKGSSGPHPLAWPPLARERAAA